MPGVVGADAGPLERDHVPFGEADLTLRIDASHSDFRTLFTGTDENGQGAYQFAEICGNSN